MTLRLDNVYTYEYNIITMYNNNKYNTKEQKEYTMFTMRISRKDMAILEEKANRLGMKKAEFIKHLIRLKDLELK